MIPRKMAAGATLQNAMLGMCIAATALVIGPLLRFCAYGFDFSDDAFYVVWASNPWLYDWSISQFGYIYHPLYSLVGGDVAAFRRVNVLLTYASAFSLMWVLLLEIAPQLAEKKGTLAISAGGLAAASLSVFNTWLISPSYNSLTLQALLITATGIVLSERNDRSSGLASWAIGLGGWLAFMAKPSTAVVLGLLVALHFAVMRRLFSSTLAIAVGVALGLTVLSALVLDGSLPKFIERLRIGAEFGSFLGGGHSLASIIRFDDYTLGSAEKTAIWILAPLTLLAARLAAGESRQARLASLSISAAFLFATLLLATVATDETAGLGSFKAMISWGAVLPAMALGVLAAGFRLPFAMPRSHWSLAALFLALPYAFAFGTGNNYWTIGGYAMIFWIAAGLVLAGPRLRSRDGFNAVPPLGLATLVITGVLLQTGYEQPYRLAQPLRLNDKTVEIGAGSRLVFSETYGQYMEDAITAARRGGLPNDTPVIDMTGQSPGILLALRAQSIGQAWMIGAYSGSARLAMAALARVNCEQLSSAWVLHEPNGPRTLPPEVLASIGADPVQSYMEVASWQTAGGAGGYPERRLQVLLKPVAPQKTLEACSRLRART